jgi:hypothetical protein
LPLLLGKEKITLESFADAYSKLDLLIFFVVFFFLYIFITWCKTSKNADISKIAWGLSGGSISGLLCFIKDALSLAAADGVSRPFATWQIWLMIYGALFTSVVGVMNLSQCMKRYDATYSASMFVGSYVTSATSVSIIRYNILDRLAYWQLIVYPLGLVILFIGIAIFVMDATGTPGCLRCCFSYMLCTEAEQKPLISRRLESLIESNTEVKQNPIQRNSIATKV